MTPKFDIRGSVRKKLMLVGLSVTAVALLIAGIAALITDYQLLKKSTIRRLSIEASILGDNCTAALTFNDRQGASEVLETVKSLGTMELVVIFNKEGEIFSAYRQHGNDSAVPSTDRPDGAVFSFGGIDVFKTILLDGEPIGRIYLRSSPEEITRRVTGFILFLLVSITCSMFIAYLLLSRLQLGITSPVLELAQLMKEVSEERKYSVRAPVRSGDEFGQLAMGFNEMIEQLQKREQELNSHRLSLQQLVTARTEDLARANELLEKELEGRVKAQRALMMSAQEWRETFDAISDQVALVSKEGKIIRCNKATQKLLDMPFSWVIERACCDLLHDHGADLSRCPLHIASLSLKSATVDMQRGTRWYRVTVDPILGDQGRPTAWVHIMSDITDRKDLQDKLNQSQKMEAVGRLAGGVAHDFNNILSVIISYSNFVLQELPPDSPMAADLQQIKASGERAAALTRQLLAFSRKQVVNPEVLSVANLIKNLSKMLGRLIGEHIQMELRLPENTGFVYMDPSQLEGILVNLTVNSRDAMPTGGRLIIETMDVKVPPSVASAQGVPPGDYVAVAVRDTGTGMSRETLSKVFEPFFTTKPKGKGTGLGLSMVYGAVKQGGGFVEVQSELGTGTNFIVYLKRVADPAESPEVSKIPADLSGNGETVLLVEDEESVRISIFRILTGNGYSVTEAANGMEALEIFKQGKSNIRFVLTDIVMPGISGVELGRLLLEQSPDLKILYMTGYSEEALSEQNVHTGKLNLITKPFRQEDLLKKIKEGLTKTVA
jgi:PAS domain S-box-containing protein